MRPFTAEDNLLLLSKAFHNQHNSLSPRRHLDVADKKLRALKQTNNVHAFLNNSLIDLDSPSPSIRFMNNREINDQLLFIKQQLNLSKKRFSIENGHARILEQISNEGKLEEKVASLRLESLQARTCELERSIADIKAKQEDFQNSCLSYEHVLKRTKQSHMFLEIRHNWLKDGIRLGKVVIEGTQRAVLRDKRNRSTSQQTYRLLHKVLNGDAQETLLVVEKMSKDVEIRETLKSKHGDRIKRLAEIAEIAADESQDSKYSQLREGVFLSRLWAGFLAAKFTAMQNRYLPTEVAFRKIRAVTGETNFVDMVHKFLTREQTFKELKSTIDSSRKSIQELNEKNIEFEKVIKAASVRERETRNADLFYLKEKKGRKEKDVENEKIRLKELRSLCRHIGMWSRRKIESLKETPPSNENLCSVFKRLQKIVSTKLKTVKPSKFY
jgi:hypothetical protein